MKTLSAIYGPNSYIATRLMTTEKGVASIGIDQEIYSGVLFAYAGNTPILIHRGFLAPAGISALRDAGVEPPSNVEAYCDEDEYLELVEQHAQRGERAVYYFSNPAALFGSPSASKENTLLQWLNNKQHVSELLAGDGAPERTLLHRPTQEQLEQLPLPVVLKIASDAPYSGGKGVAVCQNRFHLRRAGRRLCGTETLLAEQYVPATHNWCVQCAVLPDGRVEYAAASQQLCTRSGRFGGNIFDPQHPPSEAVIGLALRAAQAASERGFRGLCGIDILEDQTGQPFAIDLNFRPVSSSSAAFWYHQLASSRGLPFGRLASLQFDGRLDRLLGQLQRGIDTGYFVPLCVFDPIFGGMGAGPCRCQLLILASNRREIALHERWLLTNNIRITFIPRTLANRSAMLIGKLRCRRHDR